ncbi:carbon-nitrogen hydrolase [Saccharata proteae CBS 121410]|uniref:Carbon-nitrogen hydrolase n=1 Tax=Saccharata proteae CBS 121410 TaxID=1314787 RepID=A0A9P4HSC7_9PEZI|nr:carbon-nitrogen hydrolase [Saccharata proteae CBS 121410]
MPQTLKLAVAQSRTLSTTSATLHSLEQTTKDASKNNVDLILFPEAYLGGYPRTATFGASIGSRLPHGRDQYLAYFHSAVDLGDTPRGAGDEWVDGKLPVAKGNTYRGDGTREELERIARETGVFLVVGVVERAGGSLYCAVLYICPRLGVLGKRRKVLPTGTERLVWAQGAASTLRAVTTVIKGVRVCLAAAICWENLMPLTRMALYEQNVNLYLAPTADARDSWVPLMRTVACESRAWVLSANQCVRRKNLPLWIREPGKSAEVEQQQDDDGNPAAATSMSTAERRRRKSTITETPEHHQICWPDPSSTTPKTSHTNGTGTGTSTLPPVAAASFTNTTDTSDNAFVSRGGSCIVSPLGDVVAGPLWEIEDGGLLAWSADFEDCERGRLDLDLGGSYARRDAFHFAVEGLSLDPPP